MEEVLEYASRVSEGDVLRRMTVLKIAHELVEQEMGNALGGQEVTAEHPSRANDGDMAV